MSRFKLSSPEDVLEKYFRTHKDEIKQIRKELIADGVKNIENIRFEIWRRTRINELYRVPIEDLQKRLECLGFEIRKTGEII